MSAPAPDQQIAEASSQAPASVAPADAAPAAQAAEGQGKGKSKGQMNNEKGKKKKESKAASSVAEGEEGAEEKESKVQAPWVMPEYMQHRIAVWEAAAARRQAEREGKEPQQIKVTLPDGKVVEATAGVTTPMDIAKGISNSLAERIIVAKVGEKKDREGGQRSHRKSSHSDPSVFFSCFV